MRPSGAARDVTPEGGSVARPQLFAVGDRVALIYADLKGAEAGIHARWLDAEGRIAGPARAITARKPNQNASPTIARAPDGTFWAAWEDDRQADSSDLYLRHLSAELEPIGNELRATDYVPRPQTSRARSFPVGIAGGFLNVAFRFEREPLHLIDSAAHRPARSGAPQGAGWPRRRKAPPRKSRTASSATSRS